MEFLQLLAEITRKYKKQLYVLGGVFVALLLIFLLWRHNTYSSLIVTTNDPDAVVIVEKVINPDSGEYEEIYNRQANAELTVSAGDYALRATSPKGSVIKSVSVKGGEDKKVALLIEPAKKYFPEPVTSVNAADLRADSTGLSFLDVASAKLTRIGADNNISSINTGVAFEEIKWSESNKAIGIDFDKKIYEISGGSVKELPLPTSRPNNEISGVTITPGGQHVLALGPDVYLYQAGRFEKIYSSSTPVPVLVAGENQLAILSPPPNDNDPESGEQPNEPFVEIISYEGNSLAKKPIEGRDAFWSPNSDKLLIANPDGVSVVYDIKLNKIAQIPMPSVSSAVWADNQTIFYAVNNLIWVYAFSTGRSYQAARLVPGNIIVDASPDKNREFIYFSSTNPGSVTTDGEEESFLLFRIDLSGQPPPDYIQALAAFLPVQLDSCFLNYVNFKGTPAITALVSPDLKSVCQNQLEIELIQDKLDIKNYRVNFDILLE